MGKVKSSAFWWFMYHLQKEEYYKTKKMLPMAQLSGPAGEKWRNMTPEERKPFIDRDKEYKAGERYPLRDFAQEMSNRKVKAEPDLIKSEPDAKNSRPESRCSSASITVTKNKCRRDKLTDSLRKFIENTDVENLKKQKFYFIASNVLCATTKEIEGSDDCSYDYTYYPMEIGIVEYCIADGITFSINKFTDPGKTPVAMARVVKEHAKKHEIETSDLSEAVGCSKDLLTGEYDLERRRQEYDDLVCDLHDIFVNSIIDEVYIDEGQCVKIVFSETGQIEQNKGCLKKIGEEAGIDHFADGIEVLDLADLFFFLSKKKGYGISALLLDMIESSKYDYDGRCDYHSTKDVRYCALTVAKKHCWLVSEHLCKLYEIDLKPNHLPLELRAKPVVIEEPDNWYTFNTELTTSKVPQRRRYFDEDFDQPLRPVSETHTISWPTSVGRGSARNLPSDTSFKREAPSPRNGLHFFPATDVRISEGKIKAESCATSSASSSSISNGDHLPRLPDQESCTSPFGSRDDKSNGLSNNGDIKPPVVPEPPRPLGRGRARQSRPNV